MVNQQKQVQQETAYSAVVVKASQSLPISDTRQWRLFEESVGRL